MIATRPPAPAPDQATDQATDHDAVRRLVVTDYSRQLVAGAIYESLVEALHVRAGALCDDERAWLRSWLATAVPRMTERTVNTLAAQLEAALWTAPAGLLERLEERRRRAGLGVE
ncbi:MAG TPA: hypothetical protein VFS32_12475 [Candidatus Limnocylindrales bacterium]|nr:hypothetical protein [Candidatus Limnocylindrales bacterium]